MGKKNFDSKKEQSKEDFNQLEEQVDDLIKKLDVSDIDSTGITKDLKEKIEKSTPKELENIEKELDIDRSVEEIIKEVDDNNIEIPFAVESISEEDEEEEEQVEEESSDGYFTIKISDDKMTATIDLVPSKGIGKPLYYNTIKKEIEKIGIVYGVNYELLQKLVESVEKTKEEKTGVIIAQGTPPEDGEDGRIEFHFSESEDVLLESKDNNNKEDVVE